MTRGFFACSGHAGCTRGVNTSNRNKGEGLLVLDHRAGAIPLEIYGSSNKTKLLRIRCYPALQCGTLVLKIDLMDLRFE